MQFFFLLQVSTAGEGCLLLGPPRVESTQSRGRFADAFERMVILIVCALEKSDDKKWYEQLQKEGGPKSCLLEQ